MRTQFEGTVFIANGYPLKRLILHAYDLQEFQLSGGPGWMETELFDVAAKVPDGEGSSVDANRARLRALLAERFGLVVHRETKQATVLVLKVNNGGPKVARHAEGDEIRTTSGLQQVNAKGGDMRWLARILSARLGQPVVDRTELAGRYDFTMKWDRDPDQGNGPSVFTALREQLGLKLDSDKAPLEVLVVDRAMKPADN